MKTIMRIVCAVLAMCALAACGGGSNARAETTMFGESCGSVTVNDVFDGEIAIGHCIDYTSIVSVGARCMKNITELMISPNKYMLEDGLRLRTALDGVENTEWFWIMSDSHEVLHIFPVISTIKEILEHSRLQIRIIESDGDVRDADIDISRFGEAIAPVRELCGW